MGQKLLSVPRFDQVAVGINGGMARMRTVHPLDFARIKRQLLRDFRRDPLKNAKDMAQAGMIEMLVQECLPHLTRQLKPFKCYLFWSRLHPNLLTRGLNYRVVRVRFKFIPLSVAHLEHPKGCVQLHSKNQRSNAG